MSETNATVISLPILSADAYDRIADRVNALLEKQMTLFPEYFELYDQFVDDDLLVKSGPRRGRRLTKQGRERRLKRLLALEVETHSMREEERLLRRRAGGYPVCENRYAGEEQRDD